MWPASHGGQPPRDSGSAVASDPQDRGRARIGNLGWDTPEEVLCARAEEVLMASGISAAGHYGVYAGTSAGARSGLQALLWGASPGAKWRCDDDVQLCAMCHPTRCISKGLILKRLWLVCVALGD